MKLLCHVFRTSERTFLPVWSFQLQQNICPSFLNVEVTGRKGQSRSRSGVVLTSDPRVGGTILTIKTLSFFIIRRDERSWQVQSQNIAKSANHHHPLHPKVILSWTDWNSLF